MRILRACQKRMDAQNWKKEDGHITVIQNYQFHDRRICNYGSIGNASTGDGHSGPMESKVCNCLTKLQDEEQIRIAVQLEEWVDGMVETSAFKKAMEMLNKGTTWITIKGSPGEGKTTVAKMALRELQKSGRQVFQVTSPEEFIDITKINTRPVIMLDDIFGQLEFNLPAWQRWEGVFKSVLGPKDHHLEGSDMPGKDEATVLLLGRDYVLNASSVHMGRFYDVIIHDSHVINMSHETERTLEEKKKIWDAVVGRSGKIVSPESKYHIFKLKGRHGFPHVCRLFVTLHSRNNKIPAEKFFESPLTFLNETVQLFLENKVKVQLFKKMVMGGGKVRERDLEVMNVDGKMEAIHLLGTYLRKEDGYFVFDHPSIYDSVAFNLCKFHTLFVLENCHLSFIHERLRLKLSYGRQHESSETDLVFILSLDYVGDLAKRFVREISKKNLVLVLSHQACTQEVFIKEMMSKITLPLRKLIELTDSDSDKTFLSLIASSKSPLLLKYIDRHPSIQLTESEINTILFQACMDAASDVLVYLSKRRITFDINVKYGKKKQTPLMIAAETRDTEFVQQVMSMKPDLNVCDDDDKTAFHYLCENGLVSAAKQAVDTGTDINVKNKEGQSPLYNACNCNQTEVVRLLVDRAAKIDSKIVGAACDIGNTEIVNILFEGGATVNMKTVFGTPLHSACVSGHVEVIQCLLEKGASINRGGELGMSSLHWSCVQNKPEAAQFLLDNGAVTDSRDNWGNTPLYKAAKRGSKKSLHVLLKAGSDVNVHCEDGYSPLHAASGRGYNECADALLKAGADVNAKSNLGKTPLHKAAERGSESGLQILLKAGADVNVQCEDGYTPLHTAAGRGFEDCVDVLLKAGADVNLQSKDGSTLLHSAVYNKSFLNSPYLPNISLCQLLIKQGVNINKPDTDGNTPLHLLCCVESDTEIYKHYPFQPASSYGDVYRTLVSLLVEEGAVVNFRNKKNESALRGWCQGLFQQATCDKKIWKFKPWKLD